MPLDFADTVAADTLRRLRAELRPVAHAAHALNWIRGAKAVASSSPIDRVRLSLEVTGLLRFFEPRLFSASEAAKGKPAPDLLLLAAKRLNVAQAECIVVEDSAGSPQAAGMRRLALSGAVLPRGGSHAT